MKIAVYIFKIFFPLLIGALSLFVLGFEIVDLFMNIWKYLFNNVPVPVILRILGLYLPKTITFALPLSMLFATCYMLCILSSHNELVALFASGISYVRAMIPLMVFAALLSVGYFIFEDKVVVPCYKEYTELKNSALNIEQELNNNNVVIRSHDGLVIYKTDLYEDSTCRLYNLMLVIRNEDHSLRAIVKTSTASWNEENGKWELSTPICYRPDENGQLKNTSDISDLKDLLDESPDTFKNNKVDVETITIKEAKEYITYLQKAGLPSGEAKSVYYKKFSFPYVILIVTVLAIGLSGRWQKNVIIISMILSLSAAVLFYVLQMVTMLFAKFGFVTPLAGAWFPVIVFFIISIVLLRYAKT